MSYFAPRERRTAQMTFRLTPTLKARLEKLAGFWQALERMHPGAEKAEVSPADVVIRLCEIGLDGAWGEVGGEPRNDEEMAERIERSRQILTGESPDKQ
jgi:hypothetical protein